MVLSVWCTPSGVMVVVLAVGADLPWGLGNYTGGYIFWAIKILKPGSFIKSCWAPLQVRHCNVILGVLSALTMVMR